MDLRIFCLLCSFALVQSVTGTKGPECETWKNVTDVVKRLDPLNVTCNILQPCIGFECSGVMSLDKFYETVHFVVSLVPCSDPLKFKVLIDIPKYPSFDVTLNVSKNQVVNNTFPLPGLTRSIGQISIEGKIMIVLSYSLSVDGVPIVTIEMTVTVKMINSSVGKTFVLIPKVTFPVPTCSFQTPPTVKLGSLTSNSTPELTGDSCSAFSLEIPCKGNYQMCNKDGKCLCLHGYSWNDDAKKCDTSPSSKTNAWVIAVATVSTIIVMVGFVLCLVYKYRRNRDRYGQHTLLINNDNDTELDDPDPPMLTG